MFVQNSVSESDLPSLVHAPNAVILRWPWANAIRPRLTLARFLTQRKSPLSSICCISIGLRSCDLVSLC